MSKDAAAGPSIRRRFVGVLKLAGASLLCFVVPGAPVLNLWMAGIKNWTDRFTTDDPLSPPLLVFYAVAGYFYYLPVLVIIGSTAIGLAAWTYVALQLALGRSTSTAWSAACGALAALLAGAAYLGPELLLTPRDWLFNYGIGALLGGAAAGCACAWLLRGRAIETNAASSQGAMIAVLAGAIALAGLAVVSAQSLARAPEVQLRADGKAAVRAFRAATPDEQEALVTTILASPTSKGGISERSAVGTGLISRPLRDAGDVLAELGRLRQRFGPILSTRELGMVEGPSDARVYSMRLIDRHADESSETTLVFRRDGDRMRLERFGVMSQGNRGALLYVAMLLSRS